jgi:hypothetical protein
LQGRLELSQRPQKNTSRNRKTFFWAVILILIVIARQNRHFTREWSSVVKSRKVTEQGYSPSVDDVSCTPPKSFANAQSARYVQTRLSFYRKHDLRTAYLNLFTRAFFTCHHFHSIFTTFLHTVVLLLLGLRPESSPTCGDRLIQPRRLCLDQFHQELGADDRP